jgi:NDP-sugar pyrophosphorylase family protein
VFPTLLDRDVPFFGHEIDDYWNDVGSLREFRQGNFDALTGQVRVQIPGSEIAEGLRAADSAMLEGPVLMEPPVYLGEDCSIGADVRMSGPVVLGDGCSIGEGASLHDVLLWPGTDVVAGTLLVGGITGVRPLAERLGF